MPNTKTAKIRRLGDWASRPGVNLPISQSPNLRFSLRRRSAFTLIEILTVLGIMALVAVLSLPMLIPMMRSRSIENAADMVKTACIQARSKAIQERRMMCVTVLESERCVLITGYDDVAKHVLTAWALPTPKPGFVCPHYVSNWASADDRFEQLKTLAVNGVQYLPEGCRFDLDNDSPLDNTPEPQGWTWVFLPNGSAHTLTTSAVNARDGQNWVLTTYMVGGKPAGPRIYAPENRDSVTILVYGTTGQVMSE